MAEPTAFLGLRKAFAQTLRLGGITLLGDPRRFVAFMLDIADQSLPEVRLAAQQINADLLSPLLAAARTPNEATVVRARSQIEEILIRDRFVNETYARTVAGCMAGGFADFMGVSLPDATNEAVQPAPEPVHPAAPVQPTPEPSHSAPTLQPKPRPKPRPQPPVRLNPASKPSPSSNSSNTGQNRQKTGTTGAIKPYQIYAIAAGKSHSVGLRANGTVVAVGDNYHGQCDVSAWRYIEAVAAGDTFTVGLRDDGDVLMAGMDKNMVIMRGAKAIAACGHSIISIKKSGAIEAYGVSDWYQRVLRSSEWKHVVSIAIGPNHIVGLRSDGTVVAVGNNGSGKTEVSRWRGVNAIAAGSSFTLGLCKNGKVLTTASFVKGGNVNAWSDIIGISAGSSHSLGVTKNGTVVATGANSSKQCNVGTWEKIVSVAAGERHSLGLRSDGKVLATGANYRHQCDVSSW